MTENQAMSDERLEDLRRDVMSQVASAGGRTRHSDAYAEMLDEIDRLRAENERLTAWLTHIKNTGDEFGFIAEEALDGTPFEPEPTSSTSKD